MKKKTKRIYIGNVPVGGGAPIPVQSMVKNPTTEIKLVLDEIKMLESVGCEIVRISIPDMKSVKALSKIKPKVKIPIIADIHFDWKIAIACLEEGVDGLRLNPGNIGEKERIEKIVMKARKYKTPIRIGVNAGSLENDILKKYKAPTPEALVESALRHTKILEELDFHDIKVSLKSSDVPTTVKAYELFSEVSDYPLHIGITEAGTKLSGAIRSAIGIGVLLWKGIGDTIRVSLSGASWEEVIAGKRILSALGLREKGAEVIACPTCARSQIDVVKIAEKLETSLKGKLKVAVIGCIVNGPGEALLADIGIVGGKNSALIYFKGKKLKKVKKSKIIEEVLKLATLT